jgi:hypothetical protein
MVCSVAGRVRGLTYMAVIDWPESNERVGKRLQYKRLIGPTNRCLSAENMC